MNETPPSEDRVRPARRVLVVAPQPIYQDRGTPIAVRHVLKATSELGYRVDLLTFPLGEDLSFPGLRIIRGPNPLQIRRVPIGFSARKVVLDAGLLPTLHRRIHSGAYDTIHAVEEGAFLVAGLRRAGGPPILYDMQSSLAEQMMELRLLGSRPARAILSALERWLFHRVHFVACSTGLASRVRAARPELPVEEWIYPGQASRVRSEDRAKIRSELGIPPDSQVITYTGTFEPYQGMSLLRKAITRVHELIPDAVFVLVGWEHVNGKKAALLRGAGGRLHVVDRQPRERIPAFLAASDVLVSVRAYGGNVPLKVFDYLAAGKPIVATDDTAHRGILSEATAVMVAPNPRSIADGIINILKDRSRAEAMARAARSYTHRHLGWRRFRSQVETVYAGVTHGG